MNIQKNILKIANKILADYDYIYDPDHKKNPGGGYERTEKGWSKDKSEKSKGSRGVKMTNEQKSWHELAVKGDRKQRETIAQLRFVHPFTLDVLSRDEKNGYLRAMVAGNELASPKTLKRLSGDSDSRVRIEVGANPTSTFEIQKNLSEDRDEDVRAGVAANRKIHEKIAEKLSEDKSVNVRRRLAENTSVPKEALKKLSRDHDYVVRSFVAGNYSVDVDVLEELSRDKFAMVRQQVAYNGKSTNEILENLRNDRDFEVSEAADDALRERAKK